MQIGDMVKSSRESLKRAVENCMYTDNPNKDDVYLKTYDFCKSLDLDLNNGQCGDHIVSNKDEIIAKVLKQDLGNDVCCLGEYEFHKKICCCCAGRFKCYSNAPSWINSSSLNKMAERKWQWVQDEIGNAIMREAADWQQVVPCGRYIGIDSISKNEATARKKQLSKLLDANIEIACII